MIDEHPTVTGTVIGSGEYPYYKGLKEGKQLGYNRAIDEFFQELQKYEEDDMWLRLKMSSIYEIAEYLKAGGKNE